MGFMDMEGFTNAWMDGLHDSAYLYQHHNTKPHSKLQITKELINIIPKSSYSSAAT
jgi:hypothetical protein